MLIESRIKPAPPKPFRTITLFGSTYQFKPVLPGRYVAAVTEPKHIDTFLANPAYAEFTETLPSAELQRGAPAPVDPVGASAVTETIALAKDALPETAADVGDEVDAEESDEAEPGDDAAEDVAVADSGAWPTSVADEAAALLRQPLAKLPVAIGSATSVTVVECALAMEKNKVGRQKPRAAVIELLEGTLRDIAAAG